MKALGYPRLISVENFRTPNFELVADVLFWLVHRYEPTAELTDDISGDQGVEFLKAVAQIVYQKAHIKLNIKKLYRADGMAVRELLKVSKLLYDALQTDTSEANSQAISDLTVQSKLKELQASTNLAPKIVDGGAKVFTLLANEEQLKKSRDRALKFLENLTTNLDSANDPHEQIQRNIREQINLVDDNIVELEKLSNTLETDEGIKSSKIEKKKKKLLWLEKRYAMKKTQRPAFMVQYDRSEEELRHVYDTYLERFRNLHYLESELTKYHQIAMEKKRDSDRALKDMQDRIRVEELKLVRGEGSGGRIVADLDHLDNPDSVKRQASNDMYGSDSDSDPSSSEPERPSASHGRSGEGEHQMPGSSGSEHSSDDDDESSLGHSGESSSFQEDQSDLSEDASQANDENWF
jgi:clusterin-associated protein 1